MLDGNTNRRPLIEPVRSMAKHHFARHAVACLLMLAIAANPAYAADTSSSGSRNAKVYAVFFSVSPELSKKIVDKLQSKCPTVKFVGKDVISGKDTRAQDSSALKGIAASKSDLDGLALFCAGFSDEKYLLTGLPTIVIDCGFSNPRGGFKKVTALAKKHGTSFITGSYRERGFSSDRSQFRPGDIPTPGAADILAQKVRLFGVISRLKKSTLLSIQDYDRINAIGRLGWSGLYGPKTPYDKAYPGKLKESLGVDISIVRSKEYYKQIGSVEKKEAERVADAWIKEAEAVIGVTRDDVIRSAGLYIALKKLMKKHHADAITLNSWALIPDGVIKAMPPLAEMELSKQLIPCCCESMINCLVTQMIGTYMTGRPGYAADIMGLSAFPPAVPASEMPYNMLLLGHCYGPINPHGKDRVPYTIRNHAYYELRWSRTDNPRALWKKDQHLKANKQLEKENITLVAIRVKWPVDEAVTIVKTNIFDKQIEIYTGRTVDGNYLYRDFDNRVCRTKMAISLDKPFKQRRRDRWGCHRVVFYGHHKQKIKDFASLVGLEVME